MGRFTEEDINTIIHFAGHFGERLMQYVIVLFKRLDDWKRDEEDKGNDGNNIDEYINSLTECPRNFLRKCNNRYIAFDNTLKGYEADEQVKRLIDVIEKMVNDNGGSHYTNDDYAEAEKILQERIAEEKAQKERELQKLQEKIQKATEDVMRKEFEQQKKQLTDQLEDMRRYMRRQKNKGGFCSIQ